MNTSQAKDQNELARQGALSGLVVLDLSTGRAGAIASMILSDLGARVLRAVSHTAPLFRDGGFVVWDRAKEAITLDLATEDGQSQLDRLIPGLDILIEDQPPSSPLQRLFDPDRLKSLNPHLISCSITAFGMKGPWRELPPDDDLVMARSGMLASQPGFRGSPIHLVHRIPSVAAALCACAGIGASLYQRQSTGRGRRVETSLLAGALFFQPKVSGEGMPRQMFQRHPQGTEPFYGIYECSDGRFINPACVTNPFTAVCAELLGLKDMVSQPRFNNGRVYTRDGEVTSREAEAELRAAIAAAFLKRSSTEWARALEAADIPYAIVGDEEEGMRHPQVAYNRATCNMDDPIHGALTQLGVLSDFQATPMRPQGPRAGKASEPPALPAVHFELAEGNAVASLPLSGIRVLEISNIVAGPAVGRMLVELGAEVIKLEPPTGDLSRGFPGRTFFDHVNFGKQGICIDARKDGGEQIIHCVAASCDALVANIRPGATERMGIGPDKFPDLVESHVTAYGWSGPFGKSPGLDPIAQALTGYHMAQRGDGNPPTCLNLMGPTDYACGILGAFNLVVGLYVYRRTGVAQRVVANLQNGGILLNSDWFTSFLDKPARPLADKGQHGLTAFHRLYQLEDGWIYLAADTARDQRAVLEWLGLPQDSSAWSGHPADSPTARAMADKLKKLRLAPTISALESMGIPAVEAAGRESHIFLEDPHARANDFVFKQPHPQWRTINALKNFICFPGAVSGEIAPVPALGEHTRKVLADSGCTQEEIEELLRKGVIVSPTR